MKFVDEHFLSAATHASDQAFYLYHMHSDTPLNLQITGRREEGGTPFATLVAADSWFSRLVHVVWQLGLCYTLSPFFVHLCQEWFNANKDLGNIRQIALVSCWRSWSQGLAFLQKVLHLLYNISYTWSRPHDPIVWLKVMSNIELIRISLLILSLSLDTRHQNPVITVFLLP